MTTLTATAFEKLLVRLDSDPTKAAGLYEELRLKLTKCFIWKHNCPESRADTLADDVLDRIARKLEQGIVIENLNAYACEVARFVWMEYLRKIREDVIDDVEPNIAVNPGVENDPDQRLLCLRECLPKVAPNPKDQQMILGYYDTESDEKNKVKRKSLAERLGMTMINLKTKACRLRERLEKCINECVRRAQKV